MQHSKRSQEGWLMIDHRESPGVSDAMVQAASPGLPPGAGCGMFEAPTITCSHCQAVVILNPARQRYRAWCRTCDRYICYLCNVALQSTGTCKTFEQVIEEVQERRLHNG